MTNTNAVSSAPSVDLAQLVSALQSMGINVASLPQQDDNVPQPTIPSCTVPTFSARISSPWAPSSVISVSAPALDVAQQEETATTSSSPATMTSSLPATTPSSPAATPATPDDALSGFLCQHCQQYNVLRSSNDTWYTVTAGRNVGVFRGWHRVQPLVSGVPHASYRKYSSEAATTAAFDDARTEGLVVVIN